MKIKGYGNVKEEEIFKLEDEIGFTLPNDYKEFLINFNGGVPEVKYSTFKLNELEENIGLQVLYGLDLEENLNLIEKAAKGDEIAINTLGTKISYASVEALTFNEAIANAYNEMSGANIDMASFETAR